MTVQSVRLLLVEDNPVQAKLVRLELNAAFSIEMDWADDGETAVKWLADGYFPDLILLDLRLPAMSGHEVLSAIRCDLKLHSLPVVVLSTSEDERDMDTAYRMGANGYIVKAKDFDSWRPMLCSTVEFWCVWNRFPREHRVAQAC